MPPAAMENSIAWEKLNLFSLWLQQLSTDIQDFILCPVYLKCSVVLEKIYKLCSTVRPKEINVISYANGKLDSLIWSLRPQKTRKLWASQLTQQKFISTCNYSLSRIIPSMPIHTMPIHNIALHRLNTDIFPSLFFFSYG